LVQSSSETFGQELAVKGMTLSERIAKSAHKGKSFNIFVTKAEIADGCKKSSFAQLRSTHLQIQWNQTCRRKIGLQAMFIPAKLIFFPAEEINTFDARYVFLWSGSLEGDLE
jgi:hypothetical protein